MRAWQFTNTREPLGLNDVAEPAAAPGTVVLDVQAAGLCHTDVGVLEDERWLAYLAKRPITMGHEVAGVIAAVGEGVDGWHVGDRVGVCPTTPAGAPGFAYDGGFADQAVVDAQTLVRVPDAVPIALAAAGTDAGMTSYQAVIVKGRVKAGDKVGVIGLGGLGQIGARLAVLAGAEVYVAEIDRGAWPLAEEVGARDVKPSIADFGDVAFDVVVDFAGFGTTTAQAIEAVRVGGHIVQVGLGRFETTISTRALISRRATLVGSQGGTKDDIRAVYDHFASGAITPRVTEIDFDGIPDGLERLRDGRVVGRLVANLTGGSLLS
jgi:alcohol dehydrogenase, propanol-preferring